MAMLAGCDSGGKLPGTSSAEYRNVVSAFYVGLAALQVGDDAHANDKLSEMVRLAPAEPAGWANWGLLALRQRKFDEAAQRLERARDLAPRDAHVSQLLGILERNRGRSAEAIAHLRKAVEIDPHDLRSRYALAQEIERQGAADSDAQFQQQIEQILAAQPDNLAALLERCRVAARRSDAAGLKSALTRIGARSAAWPPEVQQQLEAAQTAASGPNVRDAAMRVTLLRNVLVRVPEYRESLAAIKAPAGEEAEPFTRFVRLPSPVFKPAAPDIAIDFASAPIAIGDGASWGWTGAIELDGTSAPAQAVANAKELRLATGAVLPFPGGALQTPPSPEGVVQLDFDYDFKTDVVLVGAGGVRLFSQQTPESFKEVTASTRLPQQVLGASYTGGWAADIEADGDLDIVLGTSESAPVVLRNNGDGTFVDIRPFAGISGLRQFVWADLDGDGNPDAALIDGAGQLHVFVNARQGIFRERPLPPNPAADQGNRCGGRQQR